jgi:hypothetical protein
MTDLAKWSNAQLRAMKARRQAKLDGYREAAQIMREHAQVCEDEMKEHDRELHAVRNEILRRRELGRHPPQ